jgi:hypothetical protein
MAIVNWTTLDATTKARLLEGCRGHAMRQNAERENFLRSLVAPATWGPKRRRRISKTFRVHRLPWHQRFKAWDDGLLRGSR